MRLPTTFASPASVEVSGAGGRRLFGMAALGVVLSWLALPDSVLGVDPPHTEGDDFCSNCHLVHQSPGGVLNTIAGNANLCQSCHVVGGQASGRALANGDQARPWPGLPGGGSGSGTSHRWDSGPAGHVEFIGGAVTPSSGEVRSSGVYTGVYAKTFALTITNAGPVGVARFNWSATSPGGGSGTGLLTGTNVLLSEGLAVTFVDGTGVSFQANDRWNVYVRTGLRAPTDPTLAAKLIDGQVSCSTCHDPHSQINPPFDPYAPPYVVDGGEGRHYQVVTNNADQMCLDCHAARAVTSALAGSHPVQVPIPVRSGYRSPTMLPLGTTATNVLCQTCHQVHFSAGTDGSLMRHANRVTLCTDCHRLADTATPASHFNLTSGALWPGGQYGSLFPQITNTTMRGDCDNCHQAHGWPNATNTSARYDNLLVEAEENLCFTCHDGAPQAKNLKTNFAKVYRHPTTDYFGRHRAGEGGISGNYGITNRHAECVDCHNPHQLITVTSASAPPAASGRLKGVARVSVVNGAAGTTPVYTFRSALDATPATEYEVCFLCHSSWTTRPTGQTDYATRFNSNNPSYHPIEAQGKNLNININAFVNGWRGTNLMYCADCHTSDDLSIRGPHGSTNRYILKKPYTASSTERTMSSGELCFDCHRYDTYANPDANATIQGYSRFNRNAAGQGIENGHAFHVGSENRPCYACHDSHASTSQASLIVTGRNPGITSYTRTATGGTCAPTCHGSESYTVSYPR